MGHADQDIDTNSFSSTVRKTLGVEAYQGKFYDDGTYTYVGDAIPGSATSDEVWRIMRINNTTDDYDWADGDTNFDNEWDNVTDLDYTY